MKELLLLLLLFCCSCSPKYTCYDCINKGGEIIIDEYKQEYFCQVGNTLIKIDCTIR